MKTISYSIILLSSICFSGCASDPYQGVYEGIKNQNDSKKSPQEREMNPTPSYDAYKKERDSQSGQ
jgi:hypothetical protein